MTSVHRPYRTPDELRSNSQVSDTEAIVRLAQGLFVVTQPLMATASLLARVVLIRQRVLRPRWYLLGSALVLIAVLFSGTVRPYLRPYLDLAEAVHASKSLAGWWPAIQSVASTSWAAWVIGCLPLALAAGLFIGAVGAAQRARRLPVWRDEKALDTPKDRRQMQRQIARVRPAAQPAETPLTDVQIHLGLDETTRRPFAVTVGELMYHFYLDGPTGFGKTTTLVRLIAGLVTGPAMAHRRVPIVLVNMKPDTSITRSLRAIAEAGGRRFWHVTHDGAHGSDRYNPLRAGTAHEISSAVMEAEAQAEAGGFTEPHHRAAGQRYLQLVTQVLTELNRRDPERWPRDYPTLAKTMQRSVLEIECPRLGAELAGRWEAYKAELKAERRLEESLSGLRQRVARAAESAAGDVLRETRAGLDLEEAIEAGDVVLFDLDAAADTTAAQLVGNLALEDLIRTMARLGRRHWNLDPNGDPERFALLAVDEFSALGGTILADLFQRVRSQGGAVGLSTQEAGSLDLAGQGFRETVVTNTNVILLHRQTVNAEIFAGYLGTESYLIETRQLFEERSVVDGHQVYASGQGNVRQGERFVLHPNVLRKLTIGELVVRVGSRRGVRPALVAVRRWQPDDATPPPTSVSRRLTSRWRPLSALPMATSDVGNDQTDHADQTDQHAEPDLVDGRGDAASEPNVELDLDQADADSTDEPEVDGWLLWGEDDTDLAEASPGNEPPVR